MSMKVNGIDQSIDLVNQIRSTGAGEAGETQSGQQAKASENRQGERETVKLSDQGKIMAQAKAELDKISDIDQKRVDEIKNQKWFLAFFRT